MDRDQRSRRQKNHVPPQAAHNPRSVQDRVGLERRAAPPSAPRKKNKGGKNSRGAARHPPRVPPPIPGPHARQMRHSPRSGRPTPRLQGDAASKIPKKPATVAVRPRSSAA